LGIPTTQGGRGLMLLEAAYVVKVAKMMENIDSKEYN
jgi:hypothetical protein